MMNTSIKYSVAGFVFGLTFPSDVDISSVLPSFSGFVYYSDNSFISDRLFHLTVLKSLPVRKKDLEELETSVDDMGEVCLSRCNGGYHFRLDYDEDNSGEMLVDSEFRKAAAVIDFSGNKAGCILSSFLRILYSQSILFEDAVLMHASVVSYRGDAVMFMGKSGTGKSTHSRLWTENINGSELLNDDNPTVRLNNGTPVVWGTPWSGKTVCYKNECYPLRGIVRLEQAGHNRFIPRTDVGAFVELLPGASVIRHDRKLYDRLCSVLVSLSENTKVARLECLPDRDAAFVCMENLYSNNLKTFDIR